MIDLEVGIKRTISSGQRSVHSHHPSVHSNRPFNQCSRESYIRTLHLQTGYSPLNDKRPKVGQVESNLKQCRQDWWKTQNTSCYSAHSKRFPITSWQGTLDCKLAYTTWVYRTYLDLRQKLTSQSTETPSEGNLLNTSGPQPRHLPQVCDRYSVILNSSVIK